MNRMHAPTASTVQSRDGTEIAFFTSGDGPPLVLVHGAPADHTRWLPLLPYLEPHATVHAIDRRGRGGSGDAEIYDIGREHEDIAAVVDHVAEVSGSAVDVYGHSFGGFAAFGAAPLTSSIRKLVLYEGWPVTNPDVYALPADVEREMESLAAAGDTDGVIETMFRTLMDMPDDELEALKAAPSWAGRVAAAPTLTREVRACVQNAFDPELAARITVPVLVVTGKESGEPAKADVGTLTAALPDARVVEMDGQGHVADVLAPEVFARHLLAFLCE